MYYNCGKMGHITKYCLEAPCKLEHNKQRPYQKLLSNNKKAKLSNISQTLRSSRETDVAGGQKVSGEG